MRFAFTDDQLAFRDAVRDLLAKECPPAVVRAAWPDGTDAHGARKGEGARADADRVAEVWPALAEMGVLGVARARGATAASGSTELDWVLLAEETGYAALPHPFVETGCVAAPLLAGGRSTCGRSSPDATVGRRRSSPLGRRADRRCCCSTADARSALAADGRGGDRPSRRAVGRRRSPPGRGRLGAVDRDRRPRPRQRRWRSTAARSAPPRSSSASAGGCST